MSRSLTTQDRMQNKWTPSPDMSIREEDCTEQNEEDEEDDDEDDEEEEQEEEGSEYSSSPSIPNENINFDLVYTLHTFEATVDGQASVKKGDALTLLDDSNSYWWLIRDLKTSEVGYIPAENIETPFERLARLNKHRNIELTSVEQVAHYINKVSQKPENTKKKKKVVLSSSLDVQLHILIHGENEDDIQEESYEEWVEEMPNNEEEEGDADDDADDDDDDDDDDDVSIIDQQQQQQQEDPVIVVREEPPAYKPVDTAISENFKVIRVFAGNVDVGASYHSIRVTESTSVNELLSNTLEKFHISEIETKHGRSYGKNSGVEYYLSVDTRDGDEITLDSEDKPYAIHESLTAHLTTPMPSLAQFRQFTSTTDYVSKRKRASTMYTTTAVRFCLHKRIKRVIDKSGQVHIKVSLMTSLPAEKSIKTTLFRFGSKSKKDNAGTERIDKLIATPANVIISELTSLALVKFHIISDIHQLHQYRLILHTNGKDTLLGTHLRLSDILAKDQSKERYFILHDFANKSETPSKSSSTSSSSSSKVFPEKRNESESILKRVDTTPYEQPSQPYRSRRSLRTTDPKTQPYGTKQAIQLSSAEKEADKSLSSLADLEKELHRIITSHTS